MRQMSERMGQCVKSEACAAETISHGGRPGTAASPAPEPRKHPTSNIERPTSNNGADPGLWMFDVRCWMLGVLAFRFRGPRREKSLSGNSLPPASLVQFQDLTAHP